MHGQRADDAAGFVGGLHRDDALAAARLEAVFVEIGALADAVFAGDQQRRVGHDHGQRHDGVGLFQADAAHAAGGTAHRTRTSSSVKRMLMPSRVMRTTSFVAGGQFHVNQRVARLDADGDDAAFADVGEILEAVFLTVPCLRGKEDEIRAASR